MCENSKSKREHKNICHWPLKTTPKSIYIIHFPAKKPLIRDPIYHKKFSQIVFTQPVNIAAYFLRNSQGGIAG